MDTSDQFIEFDEDGVCTHCHNFNDNVKPELLSDDEKNNQLTIQIQKIKDAGVGRKYDCIAGVSGGMDSSYVVFLAKKHGLRTLLVHFDNGWDAELAIKNIENMVRKTGFDYYNYIVNWEEFRDLQLAYLKASVVNIEVPTDMGISSLLIKTANKFSIPYILTGGNIETESVMGKDWNYSRKDYSNLLDIHSKFGTLRLKTYPLVRCHHNYYYYNIKNIKNMRLLSYSECNYERIKKALETEFGWKDYGVKHGESTFTKFYQSYILPMKFGFDKRRAHLSSQILAGHITREKALENIKLEIYSENELKEDFSYVLNKWLLTKNQFDEIINKPVVSHDMFIVNSPPVIDRLMLKIFRVYKKLKSLFSTN